MSGEEGSDLPGAEAVRLQIYTVGLSTLTTDDLLGLLRHHGIERVVDVRAVPRSRHTPQFDKETLSPFLRIRRIKYLHMKELGSLRRHARADSPNAGWRNASLRGFADYMLTPSFTTALSKLIQLAQGKTTAIMGTEAAPWRCHRTLIADALTVRGIDVIHILSPTSTVIHAMTPMAHVDGVRITYPGT